MFAGWTKKKDKKIINSVFNMNKFLMIIRIKKNQMMKIIQVI